MRGVNVPILCRYGQQDPYRAVAIYKEMSGDKTALGELRDLMFNSNFTFSMTPRNVGEFTSFMHRTGAIKRPLASWKDIFFSEAHDLDGD